MNFAWSIRRVDLQRDGGTRWENVEPQARLHVSRECLWTRFRTAEWMHDREDDQCGIIYGTQHFKKASRNGRYMTHPLYTDNVLYASRLLTLSEKPRGVDIFTYFVSWMGVKMIYFLRFLPRVCFLPPNLGCVLAHKLRIPYFMFMYAVSCAKHGI